MSAALKTTETDVPSGRAVTLQKLNGQHKHVAALLAQGVDRTSIAQAVGFTPEYVSWLTGDPLFRDHMREIANFCDAQLESQYGNVVQVITEGLRPEQKMEDRLKSARLHLEVTKRLGTGTGPAGASESSIERLNSLAERLLSLQSNVRKGDTFDGQVQVVPV